MGRVIDVSHFDLPVKLVISGFGLECRPGKPEVVDGIILGGKDKKNFAVWHEMFMEVSGAFTHHAGRRLFFGGKVGEIRAEERGDAWGTGSSWGESGADTVGPRESRISNF